MFEQQEQYDEQLQLLSEYLLEIGEEKIFTRAITPRDALKRLYREYYVFLGPESRSYWFRLFTMKALPMLAEKREERICTYIAYLRNVEFLDYMNSLEQQVKEAA